MAEASFEHRQLALCLVSSVLAYRFLELQKEEPEADKELIRESIVLLSDVKTVLASPEVPVETEAAESMVLEARTELQRLWGDQT